MNLHRTGNLHIYAVNRTRARPAENCWNAHFSELEAARECNSLVWNSLNGEGNVEGAAAIKYRTKAPCIMMKAGGFYKLHFAATSAFLQN